MFPSPTSSAPLSPQQARAALVWLLEAGVDTPISETPRSWLAPAAPSGPPPVIAKPKPEPATATAPATTSATSLDALSVEVAEFAHPLRPAAAARPALFEGPEDAPLLLLDETARIPGSEAATLLSAMMAAIGLDMAQVARVHALPWPTTAGRAARPEELSDFAPFTKAAVRLARPRAVLALGPHLAQLIEPGESPLGQWQTAGAVPMLATLSPARLLRAPKLKAEAWMHLQSVSERVK